MNVRLSSVTKSSGSRPNNRSFLPNATADYNPTAVDRDPRPVKNRLPHLDLRLFARSKAELARKMLYRLALLISTEILSRKARSTANVGNHP
jgi:hypothetical protein